MPFPDTLSNIFLLVAIVIEMVIVLSLLLSIITDSALERRQRRADLAWLKRRDAGGEG